MPGVNPAKVVRSKVHRWVDLPNVGPAVAADFVRLGFARPEQVVGVNPLHLYQSLCAATGCFQDPCVLDVFLSVSHFLAGGEALPWWSFTAQRKREHGADIAALRKTWAG